ncbi:hypothetical protein EFM06_09420 [Lactobacillus helveticus]|nr:hypothetical protein [Lactobacillus helveticus]
MHIQPDEFLGSNTPSQLANLYKQSMIAYYYSDISALKKLAQRYLELYKDSPKKVYILQASVACNFYEDLTTENVFPSYLQIKLNEYFSNLETWTYENILYFSCTQLLFRLSKSLINFSIENHINRQNWHSLLLEAILNAIFALLKMKQLDKAKELVDGFYTMKFNENFIVEQIRINFMTSLIQYTSTKDKSEIQSQLLSIKNLRLDHLYNDLKFAANQIFSLY